MNKPLTLTDKLNLLAKLESDWDGYGASKLAHKALESAYRLAEFIDSDVNWHEPDIIPMSGGEIQFEWPNMEIEITTEGKFYIYFDLNSDVTEDKFLLLKGLII